MRQNQLNNGRKIPVSGSQKENLITLFQKFNFT